MFVAEKIKKGDTLQTAASKPHGGIALYRNILANVLVSEGKVTNSASDKQEEGAESSQGALSASPQHSSDKSDSAFGSHDNSVQTSDNQGKPSVQAAVEAASDEVKRHKKTPVAGQPNRANEKLTSGSVLLSAIGDSSSNANVPSEAVAKIGNSTQSAKNKIRKFKNGSNEFRMVKHCV